MKDHKKGVSELEGIGDKNFCIFHNLIAYYPEDESVKKEPIVTKNNIDIVICTSSKSADISNRKLTEECNIVNIDFMIDGQEVEFEARLFHSHLDRILPDLRDFQVVSEMFILCENWEDFNKYLDCDEQIGHVHIARILK